jgi:hypothetical protein
MARISYWILLNCKVHNLPIWGNLKGNIACYERELKDYSWTKVQHGEDNESQLQQSRGLIGGHKFKWLIFRRIEVLYNDFGAKIHSKINCKMQGRLETPKLNKPVYVKNLGYPNDGNIYGYGVFIVLVFIITLINKIYQYQYKLW